MLSPMVHDRWRTHGSRWWVVGRLVGVGILAGCGILDPDSALPENALEFRVDVIEVVHETHTGASHPIAYLRVDIVGVNASVTDVWFRPNWCQLPLEAFHPRGASAPVWRFASRLSWPASVGGGWACNSMLPPETLLTPGDTTHRSMRIRLAEILADSLPAATYRFQTTVEHAVRRGSELHTEAATVDLGDVLLPASRHPLWPTYPRDGFRYEVTISPSPDPDVAAVAALVVSPLSYLPGTLERTLSDTCPVRLLAFATVEDRETIPVPAPMWSWPPRDTCAPGGLRVRLSVADAPRTLEVEVPTDALPSGSAVGDYAFIGLVVVDGRTIRLAVDP